MLRVGEVIGAAGREAAWKLIVAVARADGKLVEAERRTAEAWAARLGLTPVWKGLGKASLRALAEAIEEEGERAELFGALGDVATCDGEYANAEDRLLAQIAEVWWPREAAWLAKLGEPQRHALWLGLCAMAFTDQVVTGRERHLLANWRRVLRIPRTAGAPLAGGLASLSDAFQTDDERRLVYDVLYEMATTEGRIPDDKRAELEYLTKLWKLPRPV